MNFFNLSAVLIDVTKCRNSLWEMSTLQGFEHVERRSQTPRLPNFMAVPHLTGQCVGPHLSSPFSQSHTAVSVLLKGTFFSCVGSLPESPNNTGLNKNVICEAGYYQTSIFNLVSLCTNRGVRLRCPNCDLNWEISNSIPLGDWESSAMHRS